MAVSFSAREHVLAKDAQGVDNFGAGAIPLSLSRNRSVWIDVTAGIGAWDIDIEGRPAGSGGTWVVLANITGTGTGTTFTAIETIGEVRANITVTGGCTFDITLTGG